MNDVDPQAVRDFLAEVRWDAERASIGEASGWIVKVRDDEFGSESFYGIYETPEAALLDSHRMHAEVHRGHPDGEPGWTLTVHPMYLPDKPGERGARR